MSLFIMSTKCQDLFIIRVDGHIRKYLSILSIHPLTTTYFKLNMYANAAERAKTHRLHLIVYYKANYIATKNI